MTCAAPCCSSADGRTIEDWSRRRCCYDAWLCGRIRFRNRTADHAGLHHDAKVSSEYVSCGHCDSGSDSSKEVPRQTGACGQLSVYGRGGTRRSWRNLASAQSMKWLVEWTCWNSTASDHWKARNLDIFVADPDAGKEASCECCSIATSLGPFAGFRP